MPSVGEKVGALDTLGCELGCVDIVGDSLGWFVGKVLLDGELVGLDDGLWLKEG